MKIFRHRVSAFFYFLIIASLSVHASGGALKAYYDFENAVMEGVFNKYAVDLMYRDLLPKLQTIEPADRRLFFQARAEFFRGLVCAREFMIEYNREVMASDPQKPPKLKIPKELKEEMLVYFDRAQSLCEQSLLVSPGADAYVGKAMLVLSRGALNNPFAAFFAVFEFFDLSAEAVKIGPDNFEALLMQAAIKAMPPPPFGKPQKGIDELLVLARLITPETPQLDAFICYTCLAQAYWHLEERDSALYWVSKAQSVYVQSKSLEPFERKIREEK